MPGPYNFNLPEGPALEAERARYRADYGLKYDAQGRPYRQVPGGPRSYVSPVAMGTGQRPQDTTGIFRSRPQWNAQKGKWETPIDLGNILNVAVAGALGAGGLHAAGVFGGAGAGGGGAAADVAGVENAIWGSAAAKAAGYGGAAGAGSEAVRRAARGAAGSAGDMIGDTVPSLLSNAIAALAGLPAAFAARSSPTPEEVALLKQAQQLQALQQKRIEFQNPLYESVTRLAMSRLPTAQQRALTERL